MPAIIHQNQIIGQATNAEVLVKDTIGWTGKNLCNIKKGRLGTTVHSYPVTLNGITFNMLEDGTLSVTGTSTSLTFLGFSLISKGFTVGQKLKLSGVTSGDYENKCSLSIRYNADDIVVGDSNTQGETLITLTQEAINADDLHVTLRIPNNATVNEIVSPMVRKADITDPTYEPYHESVEVMHEEEIHGVNLLKNQGFSRTLNGLTYVYNTDGSVTVNGTATANSYVQIKTLADTNPIPIEGIPVILSGAPAGSAANKYWLYIKYRNADNTAYEKTYEDYGNGIEFTIPSGRKWEVYTAILNGQTVNNLVFKPMIRKAEIDDPTYRPYNPQAIQNQLNAQGVLGAKNLLENFAPSSYTAQGVTFTKNSNGSITANGTNTGTSNVTCLVSAPDSTALNKYIGKRLKMTGGKGNARMFIAIRHTDSTPTDMYHQSGNAIEFVIPSNIRNIACSVLVEGGATVNNETVYPMLRLASDPDDTYQPYAMTNRELMEKAGVWTTPVSCLVGDTTCTITNSAIHTTSIINPYIQTASGAVVAYSNLAVTEGQAVITFGVALTEAASVKLQILNI